MKMNKGCCMKGGWCMDDRSWTCFFLANIVFGIIGGCIAALILTQTSLITYFKPTQQHFPNATFSVDYLWEGYRYDFYKVKETYKNAKNTCEYHNTSLLVFDSNQEEKELDCYLNARNNAEENQLNFWIKETFQFGGEFGYVRPASYFSTVKDEVINKTHKIIEENGCDIQKNDVADQEERDKDQSNSKEETTYYIEKIYGNNGLRSLKQGDTNGCWHFIRYDKAEGKKNHFICRSVNSKSNSIAVVGTSTSLVNFQQNQQFSKIYC